MSEENILPVHVSIIMDGNGRWAKKRGLQRIKGHSVGVESVRVITETCAELGIPYLSLFAFGEERANAVGHGKVLFPHAVADLRDAQDRHIPK